MGKRQQFRDQLETNIFDYKDPDGDDLSEQQEKLVVQLVFNGVYPDDKSKTDLLLQIENIKKKQRMHKAFQYLLIRSKNKYDGGISGAFLDQWVGKVTQRFKGVKQSKKQGMKQEEKYSKADIRKQIQDQMKQIKGYQLLNQQQREIIIYFWLRQYSTNEQERLEFQQQIDKRLDAIKNKELTIGVVQIMVQDKIKTQQAKSQKYKQTNTLSKSLSSASQSLSYGFKWFKSKLTNCKCCHRYVCHPDQKISIQCQCNKDITDCKLCFECKHCQKSSCKKRKIAFQEK